MQQAFGIWKIEGLYHIGQLKKCRNQTKAQENRLQTLYTYFNIDLIVFSR